MYGGISTSYPGDNWAKKLGDALQRSQAMVILLSAEAMRSPWTRREIEYALVSRAYENRLLPVLVKPTEDVPWFLRKIHALDVGREGEHTFDKVVETLKRMEADLQESGETVG